jgi:phosphoserine phosphatase
MTDTLTETALLQSWNPGPTRSALLTFLEAARDLPPERRVAVLDNDGTLWCERPRYIQLDFFLHELRRAQSERPELAERAEYRALLHQDRAAITALGLSRIALALAELFAGLTPEEYDTRAREFVTTQIQPERNIPYTGMVYQPMLELLDALRAHGFAAFIVTGGGTEFVRAISRQLYRVDPEGVVGTAVTYELQRRDGRPVLVRTTELDGDPNEGPAKISNIQRHLGRRPIFAAGNSAGDRDMLEYVTAAEGPSLALLVDHDDAEREYAYASKPASFTEDEPIRQVARRLDWTVASIARDWTQVFR